MKYLLLHSNHSLCISCNKKLSSAISATFTFPDVFLLFSTFIILAIIVAIAYFISTKRLRYYRFANTRTTILNPVPLTFSGLILGIGMGGFIDGILFHQILQWHQMLSNKFSPDTIEAKSVNMFWDGLFHAFTLLVVFTGLIALWKVSRHNYAEKSGYLLAGGLLCGWSVFNLIEGTINHHILGLHNVREKAAHITYWNHAFLATSAILFIIGYCIVSRYYKNPFKIIKT